MKEGKSFTPGPWFLMPRTENSPTGFAPPGLAVFAPALNDHDVPTRYSDDNFICGMWGVVSDEDRANAALIAAAPDLFEALRSVNKLISEAAMTGFNCQDGDWAQRLFESQQQTSRALAAATATQPKGK